MAPPPQSYFFCLLVWDAYHVVGTMTNTFELMRALQGPEALAPWKLQRICILWYPILGLILPNNRWMVMHFFMCIAVQSHRKIPKVQSFQFSSFLSEKMCMFYGSSWIIFLNLRVTNQCQDRPSTLQHLMFQKCFIFYNFIQAQRRLGLCVNVS